MCDKARAQLAVFNNFIDLPAGSRIKSALALATEGCISGFVGEIKPV